MNPLFLSGFAASVVLTLLALSVKSPEAALYICFAFVNLGYARKPVHKIEEWEL
ncbi:MAG: hypothetical protein KGI38_12365 [Thaumarchaeota archaeon]|nr:hypothetical protein [Nitrososphaerota archaeon]